MKPFVILAALGAVLFSVGVGLWWSPAGLMVGGLQMVGAAYLGAYVRAKTPR